MISAKFNHHFITSKFSAVKNNSFLNSPDAIIQLDWFRVFISAFSLLSLSTFLVDYELFLSPRGILNWEVSNANVYWFDLHPLKISQGMGIGKDFSICMIIILYIISLFSLLLGIYPRFSAFVSLVFYQIILNVIGPFGYGVDVYQNVGLFMLCIFPTGSMLSVGKSKSDHFDLLRKSNICVLALKMYLSLTYASAGLEKAFMSSWWNGKFLFSVMNDPFFSKEKWICINGGDYEVVFVMVGIFVIVFESLYGLLMWMPFIRIFTFLFIIGMHLFISYFLSMPLFAIIMIGLNIICWLPGIKQDWVNFIK